MTDATSEFFSALARRGHEPLLQNADGSVRFELERDGDTEHWLVTIHNGELAVSDQNVVADCVVRAEKSFFDHLARGDANAMAALLRGELLVQGDLELLALFQRLFPGPPTSRRSNHG